MLPKRPVSCLAVLALPVGLLLVLVVIGGYALKFLAPDLFRSSARTDGAAQNAEQESVFSKPSRFPRSLATTTKVFVATASPEAAKEQAFVLNEAGDPAELQVSDEWRPNQWKTDGIKLMPPDETLENAPWRIVGEGWNVPLRTRGGAKWLDPVLLGKFSNGRLAIVSHRTQRALLSVSRAGDIQVVDVLSDDLTPLAVQGSSVWFVRTTFKEDQPIETLPSGPSYLVSLSETGTSSTVAQDPGVILELVPLPNQSSLAYFSSDRSLVIVSGDKLLTGPKDWTPRAWLDERHLLISRQKTLAWLDLAHPEQPVFLSDFAQSIRSVFVSTSSSGIVLK